MQNLECGALLQVTAPCRNGYSSMSCPFKRSPNHLPQHTLHPCTPSSCSAVTDPPCFPIGARAENASVGKLTAEVCCSASAHSLWARSLQAISRTSMHEIGVGPPRGELEPASWDLSSESPSHLNSISMLATRNSLSLHV